MVAPWVIYAFYAVMAAVAIFAYVQMRKMQKRQQKQEAAQFDGSIADYGVKTSMTFGSAHIYGNNVDKFGEYTSAIKKKGGK